VAGLGGNEVDGARMPPSIPLSPMPSMPSSGSLARKDRADFLPSNFPLEILASCHSRYSAAGSAVAADEVGEHRRRLTALRGPLGILRGTQAGPQQLEPFEPGDLGPTVRQSANSQPSEGASSGAGRTRHWCGAVARRVADTDARQPDTTINVGRLVDGLSGRRLSQLMLLGSRTRRAARADGA
jgi:hypothetical protein